MPKPLIFVPGLPASTLIDTHQTRTIFIDLGALTGSDKPHTLERLCGPDDPCQPDGVVTGGPIRRKLRFLFIDLKEAETLYELLAGIGYDVFDDTRVKPLGWDWRLPVYHDTVQRELESAIRSLYSRHGPVVLLCHSTGGLVTRWCLETLAIRDPATLDMVEQVIAIGVPWAGTLKPVRCIGLGESIGAGIISAAECRRILGHSHAAYDLMPLGPQENAFVPTLFRDRNGNHASPLVSTEWLPANFHTRAAASHAALGVRTSTLQLGGRELRVTNIVGYGKKTDTGAQITEPCSKWPVTLATSDDGDGTIPRESAAWLSGPGVRTFHVPYGCYSSGPESGKHSQLWKAPPVRGLLEHALLGTSGTPYTWAALDPDDAYKKRRLVRIRVVGLDPQGRPLENARVYTAAVGGRRKGKEHRLDSTGRAIVVFDRAREAPDYNRYYVPVDLAWTYEGREITERMSISFLS